jgi:hypothetical protein
MIFRRVGQVACKSVAVPVTSLSHAVNGANNSYLWWFLWFTVLLSPSLAWPNDDFDSGVKIDLSDIAIAVEFSDMNIYDIKVGDAEWNSLAAAACRGWINYFPKIIIYSDDLTEFPPGSEAERACSPHVQVARCCGPQNATLNSSIVTAQCVTILTAHFSFISLHFCV